MFIAVGSPLSLQEMEYIHVFKNSYVIVQLLFCITYPKHSITSKIYFFMALWQKLNIIFVSIAY